MKTVPDRKQAATSAAARGMAYHLSRLSVAAIFVVPLNLGALGITSASRSAAATDARMGAGPDCLVELPKCL